MIVLTEDIAWKLSPETVKVLRDMFTTSLKELDACVESLPGIKEEPIFQEDYEVIKHNLELLPYFFPGDPVIVTRLNDEVVCTVLEYAMAPTSDTLLYVCEPDAGALIKVSKENVRAA